MRNAYVFAFPDHHCSFNKNIAADTFRGIEHADRLNHIILIPPIQKRSEKLKKQRNNQIYSRHHTIHNHNPVNPDIHRKQQNLRH